MATGQLLCMEVIGCRRAVEDKSLLKDDRVLKLMLETENRSPSTLRATYCVFQTNIKPFMRNIVTKWMLEVCIEERCEPEVFCLSVNYLDRYLAVRQVPRSQLQLIGTVCLFIASKLRESNPLNGRKLVIYTDCSITLQELVDYEMVVLSALKWDVSVVTAHAFVDHILPRLRLDRRRHDVLLIKQHAQTFVDMCATDVEYIGYPASLIAAASLSVAISGLTSQSRDTTTSHSATLVTRLQTLVSAEEELLRVCVDHIQFKLAAAASKTCDVVQCNLRGNTNTTTPTDAKDVVITT